VTAPRLLDLFCGAGGCTVGYVQAGFEVTGVDLHPMPHYPRWDVIQADALDVLADEDYVRTFDAVHASPPCKKFTAMHTRVCDGGPACTHLDLLTPVRARLEELGLPYIIENVEGAPMHHEAVTLCGTMFGLGLGSAVLKRHRLFESNVPLSAPRPCACAGRPTVGVYGTGGAWTRTAPGGGGVKVSGADAAAAMGVDWTTYQPVLSQMIPPAYTEHLGRQLLRAIRTSPADPARSLLLSALLDAHTPDEERCRAGA
jgi:DNA (cytosine-5)-methyltransferase 1